MNYLLYIILFILTFLFVKISCEFRLYYIITKQNFIIKMLLFAAVIVIIIRSYIENNNIEGMRSNSYDQLIQQGRQDNQEKIDAQRSEVNGNQNENKGLFTGDAEMSFNSAYEYSGELSTVYGGEVEQESGSQENITPINLDTYSKDILETIYPPSCTKTINQREKICATLDTHNKCNSSTCCAYNSYNGQNMCVAGDRNGPSTIKSLIDYYYYLGKCYPGKKSCPNKPPL